MRPIFREWPALEKTLPHVHLTDALPTPVERLEKLEAAAGGSHRCRVYIKRDDRTSPDMGGNKVRNLEFLLGRCEARNHGTVISFGTSGSNQCAATAIYCRKRNLKPVALMLAQENARYVRNNLLINLACGADLHYCHFLPAIAPATIRQILRCRQHDGNWPEIIPPGGTCPAGIAGFVNAALELRDQVRDGLLPEPDWLYTPIGTMGTAIGLLLGLKAAGMKTRIMGICVTPPALSSTRKARRLFRKSRAMLQKCDAAFPEVAFNPEDFIIRPDFFGKKYGLFTPEGMQAVRRMESEEHIQLEGTYSGKTLAALLNDLESGPRSDESILFWHTANSFDLSPLYADTDWKELPRGLHRYFTEEVQPLDRD